MAEDVLYGTKQKVIRGTSKMVEALLCDSGSTSVSCYGRLWHFQNRDAITKSLNCKAITTKIRSVQLSTASKALPAMSGRKNAMPAGFKGLIARCVVESWLAFASARSSHSLKQCCHCSFPAQLMMCKDGKCPENGCLLRIS